MLYAETSSGPYMIYIGINLILKAEVRNYSHIGSWAGPPQWNLSQGKSILSYISVAPTNIPVTIFFSYNLI